MANCIRILVAFSMLYVAATAAALPPNGDDCSAFFGVGLGSGANFWEIHGVVLEGGGGIGCHLAQTSPSRGWLQRGVADNSRGISLTFDLFLAALSMSEGDTFPFFKLENSATGRVAVRLRLRQPAAGGTPRISINWASDDASGAAHLQDDLPTVVRITVFWLASTQTSFGTPEADGQLIVWVGDESVPVFSRQDLRIAAEPADQIVLGILGGIDAGTSGELSWTPRELTYLF